MTTTAAGCRQNSASFFTDKIDRILSSVKSVVNSATESGQFASRPSSGSPLTVFDTVPLDEVLKLIHELPNKSSPRDVLPTCLLKSCADVIAPLISRLANLSFDTGEFPTAFKTALVLPLLKKPGLEKSTPANYRPISNLNTISKIVERLVLRRLLPHLLRSDKFNPMQSAYRSGHSTETALLKILDSLYRPTAIDNKQVTTIISLDLSAAFDIINHDILLQRLQCDFGITGKSLDWLRSYPTTLNLANTVHQL